MRLDCCEQRRTEADGIVLGKVDVAAWRVIILFMQGLKIQQ